MSARDFVRAHARRTVAIAMISLTGGLAQPPGLSHVERAGLAARFHFVRFALPAAPAGARRSVRSVSPSLEHLSAWISSVGAAVALHDIDGDGLPNDVVCVDPRTDAVVVSPAPGTPARYSAFVLDPGPLPFDRATMAPMGSLPGDFNEDGIADVLVYYWGRTPILFLGRPAASALGPARFVREELVQPPACWYTNAGTQADLDGDGHVDLVFGNYFDDSERVLDTHATITDHMQHSMSRAFNGGRNRLLLFVPPRLDARLRADATAPAPASFHDAGGALPDDIARGWTLAVGAQDLDGDLLPELYFANDFGPDRLLHNRSTPGRLRFELLHGIRHFTTPASKVLGNDSFKGMGIDFGDLNDDGVPDMYVSNIAAEHALEESHFAWVSTNKSGRIMGTVAAYDDRSEALGLSRSGWGWEARLEDFDNDGVPEAMQATGFVRGTTNRWPELQELAIGNDELLQNPGAWPRFHPGDDLSGHPRQPFFVRARDGRYYDVAPEVGMRYPEISRGIATADVDGDGRMDIAIADQWSPSYLYSNRSTSAGAFLGLHLLVPLGDDAAALHERRGHPVADAAGSPAIGSAAVVHLPDGRRLVAQVDGGNGHSGKRSPDLHFGLGDAPAGRALAVDLAWRDRQGAARRDTLALAPGWHTVVLGVTAEPKP